MDSDRCFVQLLLPMSASFLFLDSSFLEHLSSHCLLPRIKLASLRFNFANFYLEIAQDLRLFFLSVRKNRLQSIKVLVSFSFKIVRQFAQMRLRKRWDALELLGQGLWVHKVTLNHFCRPIAFNLIRLVLILLHFAVKLVVDPEQVFLSTLLVMLKVQVGHVFVAILRFKRFNSHRY